MDGEVGRCYMVRGSEWVTRTHINLRPMFWIDRNVGKGLSKRRSTRFSVGSELVISLAN